MQTESDGNSRYDLRDGNAKKNEDNKGQRFQWGKQILLTSRLEVIHIMFLQEICLHFAHVLRLCMRLNLKVAVD